MIEACVFIQGDSCCHSQCFDKGSFESLSNQTKCPICRRPITALLVDSTIQRILDSVEFIDEDSVRLDTNGDLRLSQPQQPTEPSWQLTCTPDGFFYIDCDLHKASVLSTPVVAAQGLKLLDTVKLDFPSEQLQAPPGEAAHVVKQQPQLQPPDELARKLELLSVSARLLSQPMRKLVL